MKNRINRIVVGCMVVVTWFVSFSVALSQESPPDKKELQVWIKSNAIPLTTKQQEYGAIDQWAKQAKVIGLGEATHGQHEAFELKRRLTMHFIRNHGYRVVAYEASASLAVATNEYIAGESNDRDQAIAGLGMLVWQVEENGKLLDDLRAWNEQASQEDRVRFVGCDAQNGKAVMNRLKQLLGDENMEIADQLASYQERLDGALREAMSGDSTSLTALLNECQTKCDEILKVAAEQSLQVEKVDIRLKEFLANLGLYSAPGQRDKVLAELLLAQINLDKNPNEKCVFWGHNGHVQRGNLMLSGGSVPAMGGHLAKALGDEYYSIGFDFGEGAFQANVRDENNKWRFRRYVHSAPPQGSMADLFSSALKSDFILDFRSAAAPAIKAWLSSEQSFRSWGGYNVPDDFDDSKSRALPKCVPGDTYDAIAFHHRTTAAQPLDSKLILK